MSRDPSSPGKAVPTEPTDLVFRERVGLADHVSLQIGGPARYWLEAQDLDTVTRALGWAQEQNLQVLPLGAGSNVVVADRGLDALVLRVRIDELSHQQEQDAIVVHAGAGVVWDDLVRWSVEHDAAGLECLAGIPGEVGAAPIQNVGAYGQEAGDAIEAVHVIDRRSAQACTLSREQCAFGYRESIFKAAAKDRYVVVGVDLRLAPDAEPTLRYPELQRAVSARHAAATLASVRETVLELRRKKSMLLDPGDPNHRSAGSFFINPTLAPAAAEAVAERADSLLREGEQMPRFETDDGRIKLPAGWLIERAGLPRGTTRGRVGLSTEHALAIVNRGGATAIELLAFATEIRARVQDRFGVSLTPEPQLLGFTPDELAPLCK